MYSSLTIPPEHSSDMWVSILAWHLIILLLLMIAFGAWRANRIPRIHSSDTPSPIWLLVEQRARVRRQMVCNIEQIYEITNCSTLARHQKVLFNSRIRYNLYALHYFVILQPTIVASKATQLSNTKSKVKAQE
jgi:hypothetical protein